jgi:hypothetical protein
LSGITSGTLPPPVHVPGAYVEMPSLSYHASWSPAGDQETSLNHPLAPCSCRHQVGAAPAPPARFQSVIREPLSVVIAAREPCRLTSPP